MDGDRWGDYGCRPLSLHPACPLHPLPVSLRVWTRLEKARALAFLPSERTRCPGIRSSPDAY